MIPQSHLAKRTRLNKICTLSTLIILVCLCSPDHTLGAEIKGTNKENTIYGTMGADSIVGKEGKDNLYGNGGADTIHGDSGNDHVSGDLANDKLDGNDGDDIVQGGSGSDEISGGKGNDTLIASFTLGSVSFRDFSIDKINCGPGYDTAYINPVDGDIASDACETVVAETAQ
jgi:Ca2+-binding RTX toxin-like protein